MSLDTATDIEVAVKIYVSMDPQGLTDFKKEFQLSFDLNHTNLLHANYLGVSPDDNRPYMVMPFCKEGSVSKFAGKMSENEIWKFIYDVSSGLAYLHDHRPPIIHQDIKPDNILLKNGDYVITDFGISKQLKKTLGRSALNVNSAGAIAYMGPERFSKQYQAVKASDIWSFGVTIYELIMGDLPFCGMGGSMQKQGAEIPELPEGFSAELKALFTDCLASETWNRPSAHEISEYARKYINGENPAVTWNRESSDVQLAVDNGPKNKSSHVNVMNATVGMEPVTGNVQYNNNPAQQYNGQTVYRSNVPVVKENNVLLYVAASVIGLVAGIVMNIIL